MGFIAGLGALVDIAAPFVETKEEENAYNLRMKEIDKDIAQYHASLTQGNSSDDEAGDNTLLYAGLGVTGLIVVLLVMG